MIFKILGCGSSMGVPRADGSFGKCNPKNKRNYRSRCSAFLKTNNENILFDTSPDLRSQLIKNKIKKIDRVLYSHMHADQTHGINDLRVFYLKNKKPISIYADEATKKYLLKTFQYCFVKNNNEYPAILKIFSIRNNLIIKNEKKNILIRSFKVQHGKVHSICYVIDRKLAYISDASLIYKKNIKLLKKLKYLIIDCLWYRKHPSHFNLDDCLNLISILKPKNAILTNLHSDLDYDELKKKLPQNVRPAYDGLTLKL